MKQSKLLKTLKLLEPAEMKRLAKFLRSPFFNANQNIVNCYYLLRKHYPQFDSPKLNQENIFRKLFPQRKYDHQKLLNLFSDFTALAESFLWNLELEKNQQTQAYFLLKSYAERSDAYETFIRQFHKYNQMLDALPQRDARFFLRKFAAEQLYFNHPATDKFKLTGEQYDVSMSHLDQYFVLEKLLLSCEVKAREIPLSEKHEIWLLKEIYEPDGKIYLQNPVAAAYAEILELTAGNEASFSKLKNVFAENLENYTHEQKQNILASLLNFSIKKGNAGEWAYVKENLELYKIGLRQKLLMQGDLLGDQIFVNIALLAAKLGDFGWCEKFIEDYSKHLDESIKADAKAYCLAYLYYGQKKRTKVIDYLNSIRFVNDFYQLGARMLFLRIYFELFCEDENLYDLLSSQTQATEKYLRRNRNISQQKRDANLEFVLTLRQMMRWKTDPNKEAKAKADLKLKIENTSPAYKSWLLEQFEVL